ncbi:polysaccharide deacetylase family protein [Spirosoma rhododendri]|uniref:ChbG/HpnK family deacetylase n=1 Tax=Spirosoma rhododendri TaxID=2728024 RepID=A0A7L5DK65_9BACT|nr:polysaccharide deacetylase family protein [Spirosoma rhododendri]QJD78839.1 ChbG/HpnK family deacetylase [Spirosoma rhododendri]
MHRICLLLSLLITHTLSAQTEPTYAEKLGFPKGKKVVILHVDDAGMSYESNAGTIQTLDKGIANSTSVMMPCGWVPQFFAYLKTKPNTDAGVHLTLTSEWDSYRWAPLTGRDKAPGLYDEQGACWHSVAQVVEHASADEVETEIRAQLARFRAFGIQPTHMDSHMGTLFEPKFIGRYAKVAMEEKIPILFPGGHATLISQVSKVPPAMQQMVRQLGQQLWNAGLPVFDDLDGSSYGWELPAGIPMTEANLQRYKTQRFISLLKAAQPGLTYIILHATLRTPTFDQISTSGPTRDGDRLAMLDPALRQYIKQEGIILTTWRELIERRKKM